MPQFQVLPQNPGFGQQLGQQLGAGIGAGINQGISQRLESFQKNQQATNLEKSYIARGMSPQLAALAAAATTGGQTEAFKLAFEELQRGGHQQRPSQMMGSQEKEPIETPEEDIGLTPKEKIRREEGRYKAQLPKYEELQTKTSNLQQEDIKLKRLQELNKENNLPKGLGRVNVDFKSGGLTLPFAASPDSQEFVKIMNDFLSGAKDTFGARVSNFEVNSFMRRLPSLLNTSEGRERVLQQMSIINEINRLHSDSVLEEIDKRGGVRKIDLDTAEKIARKKIKPEIDALKNEYVRQNNAIKSESKNSEDFVVMVDPSGKRRKVPKNQAKQAQDSGYKLAK